MHSIHKCYESAINRKGCTIITEPKLQYSERYKILDEFSEAFFKTEYIGEEDQEWLFLNSNNVESVSVVCTGINLPIIIRAAETLFLTHEISLNIISPRQLSPLVIPEKIHEIMTKCCLIVDESYPDYGFCETFIGNYCISKKNDVVFKKYCLQDTIYPSSLDLEKEFLINKDKLITKVIELNEIYRP